MLSPAQIPGQVERLINLAKSLKARFDAVNANPGALDALLETYELMRKQLQSLTTLDNDTLGQFPAHHREIINAELGRLCTIVRQAVEKLEDKITKLESKRYATPHAMLNELKFSELEQEAARASESILRISNTLVIVKNITNVHPSSRNGDGDVFQGCFTAPKNPQGITIDFESETSKGRPFTCEALLKAALLDENGSSCVGAVAAGIGGVGKTCALRALAVDRDVMKRFPDGIYFMSLGAEAATATVIEQLCNSVEATGGKRLARELRREKDLARVVGKARDWFAGRVCLFIFDDLWRSKDIREDVLVKLSVLVSHSGAVSRASALLYSTRDTSLSLEGQQVAFAVRDPLGEEATRILLTAAAAECEDLEHVSCREAIVSILKRCGGLPVSLNLCGTIVRQMRSKWHGDRREAWNFFWKNLETEDLSRRAEGNYETLGAAVLVALDFLDNNSVEAESVPRSFSFREMHRALCVLGKRDWVPVSVLQWLWKLRDRACAEAVLMAMVQVGAAIEEYRPVEGGAGMLGLRLHDLVHDFALQEANSHKEMTQWYATLLNECSGIHEDALGERAKRWPARADSTEDGGYMLRNVCRLLLGAGRLDEVEGLLHSAEWAVKVLEKNMILQFEQDVDMYMRGVDTADAMSSHTEGRGDAEVRTSPRRLCKLVRLCSPYCVGKPRAARFQLHARLVSTAHRSRWMDEMVQDIARNGPRPQIVVNQPCLKGADDPLENTFVWGKKVFCVDIVNGMDVMSLGVDQSISADVYIGRHMSNGESETTRVQMDSPNHNSGEESDRSSSRITRRSRITCGRVMKWDGISSCLQCVKRKRGADEGSFTTETSRTLSCTLARGDISAYALFADGSRTVMGWSHGALQISDAATGRTLWRKADAHTGAVLGVAVTKDGTLIVSGSVRKTVLLWDAKSGKQVGAPLTGHTGIVTSVAVSGDGERVASGSYDKTVRVWDVKSGKQIGAPLTGHFELVSSVAISSDGERVVSGSNDKTVRVWDVKSSKQVGEPLAGHTWWVTSVAMSGDGERIVSGSSDKTVRVWDVNRSQPVSVLLTGHTEWVSSVGVSSDGERVVSGSLDGTLRVWNVKSSNQIRTSPTGHNDSVSCVLVSDDGQRVVSGSNDHTVRVWDVQSGKQIGRPHSGHTDWVSCVTLSSDGERVVSGSLDRTVRVWDVKSGKEVGAPLTGHTGTLWRLAVSSDGERVLSGSLDKTIRVWDLRSQTCLRVVQDEKWDGRWDALCAEHLGDRAGPSQQPTPRVRTPLVAVGNNIVCRRGAVDEVIAAFDADIEVFRIIPQNGFVLAALATGVVAICRVEE